MKQIERIVNADRVDDLIAVFGSFDENIKRIEEHLGVRIINRDTELKVTGDADHILLTQASTTETGSHMELLPAFTRYTFDGEHFYLLYNAGTILLNMKDLPQPEAPEGTQTTVRLFLDLSATALKAKADLILVDMAAINHIPTYDTTVSLCYSTNSSNVLLTMCDGRILYENGAYTTIDIECLRFESRQVIRRYFD